MLWELRETSCVPILLGVTEDKLPRCLVLEDFRGFSSVTLMDHYEGGDHKACLTILQRVASVVKDIHSQGYAFHNLKPHNVITHQQNILNLRLVGFGRCVSLNCMSDEEAREAKSKDVIDLIAMVCSLQDLICNTVFKNLITTLMVNQNILTMSQLEEQLEHTMNDYKLRVFPYGVWRFLKVLKMERVGYLIPQQFDDDNIDEKSDSDDNSDDNDDNDDLSMLGL